MSIITDTATDVVTVAPSVLDPAFIGPRTQHTLLEMSSSVTFTQYPGLRHEYTSVGYVEGWSHAGPAAENIIIVWTEQCTCDRPCCSGERQRVSEIGWDNIDVLWSGEGYTSPVLWEPYTDPGDWGYADY